MFIIIMIMRKTEKLKNILKQKQSKNKLSYLNLHRFNNVLFNYLFMFVGNNIE